ncbi:MAG: nuclear transport factor 2 family protein [Bacteroidota bacterium]
MSQSIIMFLTIAAMFLFGTVSCTAQTPEEQLSELIKTYASSGDKQDVEQLDQLTDGSFRVVFVSNGNLINLGKEGWLENFRQKKFGGDKRTVTIQSVEIIEEANATVIATMEGEKAHFKSMLSLIKVGEDWKIVQEIPFVTFL